jgi:ABC-type xylose transport system permease subunit
MTQGQLESVIGIILPVFISLLKQEHFPNAWNSIIAVMVYLVVGVVAVAVSGNSFDLNNILPSVATFTAAGTLAYQLFWKNFEG